MIDRLKSILLFVVEEEASTTRDSPKAVLTVLIAGRSLVDRIVLIDWSILVTSVCIWLTDISTDTDNAFALSGNPDLMLMILHNGKDIAIAEVAPLLCQFQHVPLRL